MKTQDYKNHKKIVVGYHYITFFALLGLLIGSVINLINSSEENLYSASLIVLSTIVIALIYVFARVFTMKVQDRTIRAEENFRHFIMTGKPLSKELTIRQIIGLRFASDEELPVLAVKAEKEKLSENAIKKSIKNWKADTYRA